MIVGIDYGSKKSGHTVMAFYDGPVRKVRFRQAVPGADADEFIKEVLKETGPCKVYIDAPLSIPNVYKGVSGYKDYFYRKADREVSAMSPMFLGGLTARAIKLKTELANDGYQFYECYPSGLARHLGLNDLGYRKAKTKIKPLVKKLTSDFRATVNPKDVEDWHYFDALLCAIIGLRHENKKAEKYGVDEEGEILI